MYNYHLARFVPSLSLTKVFCQHWRKVERRVVSLAPTHPLTHISRRFFTFTTLRHPFICWWFVCAFFCVVCMAQTHGLRGYAVISIHLMSNSVKRKQISFVLAVCVCVFRLNMCAPWLLCGRMRNEQMPKPALTPPDDLRSGHPPPARPPARCSYCIRTDCNGIGPRNMLYLKRLGAGKSAHNFYASSPRW